VKEAPVLLPQPRRLDLGGELVPARPPALTFDPSLRPEGYELTVSLEGPLVVAADEAGAFYARATLAQLARVYGGMLPTCSVSDWPDLGTRAVMLDISRDKVPTMDTLEDLIGRLASWKVNQVQLYMEHTFAYSGHEEVWAGASPLTAEEVRRLDSYCRERHVELVPNQNCLGHMERWLRHERYRHLAVFPGGTKQRPYPTTLDPRKPGSLALVRELLAELLVCFTSPRVHVGLDEPWELPPERFDDYLWWVDTLRSLPELDGREMLVWGDVLALHPELLRQVPEGVTVCEWGYDDWHPFAERTAALSGAGVPFWVAPGTSSWLTILGRVPNMLGDCRAAMEAASRNGALGWLDTDWGDMGHLQFLPVSEPGFAYAAGVSWCFETNRDMDLARALDLHAFEDPQGSLGAALVKLGSTYLEVKPQFPNIATLVMNLYFPQLQVGSTLTEGLTTAQLDAAEGSLDAAAALYERARPRRPDGALVLEELRCATALVRLACRDSRARLEVDGQLPSVPEDRRLRLASELAELIERYRSLWLARNRPGGLASSVARLEHLLGCYRTGRVDHRWNPM
jgi:hexosaminidase